MELQHLLDCVPLFTWYALFSPLYFSFFLTSELLFPFLTAALHPYIGTFVSAILHSFCGIPARMKFHLFTYSVVNDWSRQPLTKLLNVIWSATITHYSIIILVHQGTSTYSINQLSTLFEISSGCQLAQGQITVEKTINSLVLLNHLYNIYLHSHHHVTWKTMQSSLGVEYIDHKTRGVPVQWSSDPHSTVFLITYGSWHSLTIRGAAGWCTGSFLVSCLLDQVWGKKVACKPTLGSQHLPVNSWTAWHLWPEYCTWKSHPLTPGKYQK